MMPPDPVPSRSERASAAREHRAQVREVLDWLKADLFVEERYEGEKGHRAFRNPGGFRVVITPRQDRDGLSGWIERPDGSALVVTSHMDVYHLEEYLP